MSLDIILHKWLRIPYSLHTRIEGCKERPRAFIVFLHGIGNTSLAWNDITSKMPHDIRCVSVDLFGFGESKKPEWSSYDAKIQARSVFATLLKLGINEPVIVVGHSLGSLVAVELAKRYSFLIKSLVLVSPPFYRYDKTINKDRILRRLYRLLLKDYDRSIKIADVATRLGILNKSHNLTKENVNAYMETLKSCIINQTSYLDVMKIKTPTHIIYGNRDLLINIDNIKKIEKANKNVSIEGANAGHDTRGKLIDKIVGYLNDDLLPRVMR